MCNETAKGSQMTILWQFKLIYLMTEEGNGASGLKQLDCCQLFF